MSKQIKIFGLLFIAFALLGFGCVKVEESGADGGIWFTDDAGENWEQKSVLPLATGTATITKTNINTMVFDPNDPAAMYIGTGANGMLFSYDNGKSWQRPKNEQASSGSVVSIAVDPSEKCTVYLAKGSNIMKSEDCNRTFDTETFVETSGKDVKVVKVDWFNPNIVWAGTVGGDVIKSLDGGKTWTTVDRVKDEVMDIMVSNADSRIVLVVTENKEIRRSTDGGETWARQEEELKSFKNADDGYFLAQDAAGSVFYYASKYGILVSRDQGASWEALSLLTSPGSVRIYSMAVNPDDANNLYYGTATTLYMTNDGGSNWSTRELPTTRAATALAVDPDSTSDIFMGVKTIKD